MMEMMILDGDHVNDRQYKTAVIKKVEESNGEYFLTFEDGWSFFAGRTEFVPKVGDDVKMFGKGMGYTVRGLVIDGRVVFYRTEEEQERHDKNEYDNRKEQKRIAYENSREDRTRRIEAMPEPFRKRLKGFERRNPEWYEYAEYEMFACEQAIIIAEAVKTQEGMDAFKELSFEEQMEAVEGLSDDHSGNTFGMACLLASTYISGPEIVHKIHGAMCPLVGCGAYGCFSTDKSGGLSTDKSGGWEFIKEED